MSSTPDDPAALRKTASQFIAQGDIPAALPLLWQALAQQPDDTQTLNDLGNALVKSGQPDDGLALLLRALELRPYEAKLHSNTGVALANSGLFDQALVAHQTALRLNPQLPAAHTNLGILYVMMGRHTQAIAQFDESLRLDPTSILARRNRAIALLASGDLQRGFVDYENRWQPQRSAAATQAATSMARQLEKIAAKRWTGQPLAGKRILVVAEQGIGDILHFIRYTPLLKARGAHVLFECPPLLTELLQSAAGIDQWVAAADVAVDAVQFDYHTPLMSLPRWCGTTLQNIPAAREPYLAANPARQATWRKQLALDHRLNVGIVWQGNPHHQWDRFRSVPLSLFQPLAQIPGTHLISLQRGPGTEQIAAFQAATHNALLVPTDGTQETPADLADSAAILSLLDLLITVDSAPAHLAAALGRPTWILLALAADWRWLTNRDDSPWYASIQLFRQKTIQQWEPVFDAVQQQLRTLIPPHHP